MSLITTAVEDFVEGATDQGNADDTEEIVAFSKYIVDNFREALSQCKSNNWSELDASLVIDESPDSMTTVVACLLERLESIIKQGATGPAAFLEDSDNVEEFCDDLWALVKNDLAPTPKRGVARTVISEEFAAYLGCSSTEKYYLIDLMKKLFAKIKEQGLMKGRDVVYRDSPELSRLLSNGTNDSGVLSMFNVAGRVKQNKLIRAAPRDRRDSTHGE